MFKGLKFTPTPKTNTFELKSDIRNFSRKLRLIEFFATEQGGHEEEESIHRNKSSFCPPVNRDKKLDAPINFINGLNLSQPESDKSNLSKKQWKGINDFKNNDSIIIKEADKGGCVVIMNKTHYKAMVYNQLDDRVIYKRTGKSCDKTVFNKLSKLVKKYQGDLTKKEIDYLTKFMFKTSNFYRLPKVHKSDIITKAIEEQNSEYIKISEPEDLTLRPIVAGPNCPTKRLSTFIDTIIKPLVLHIKSYIRDSIHFLQKCSRIANDRTVLCTFDVKSLYTNIPHEYGLEAMSYWLNRHQDSLNPRFSKAFILESIEFILKNNNFMFNDEYFLQLVGTATGTDMARTYATLTMGYHEVKFYSICELNWGAAVRQYIEETWGCFLDDCEIPLDQDKVKPEAIKDVLNSIHPKIQFTMEHSEEMVPFWMY